MHVCIMMLTEEWIAMEKETWIITGYFYPSTSHYFTTLLHTLILFQVIMGMHLTRSRA